MKMMGKGLILYRNSPAEQIPAWRNYTQVPDRIICRLLIRPMRAETQRHVVVHSGETRQGYVPSP